MATAATRITADEFLRMDLGDGRHELVRGEIVEMPPAEYSHGLICLTVGALLLTYSRQTGHGHVASNDSAVGISDDTVRGADVCYYSEARWPRSRVGKERPPVPPDLVVEVLSSNDRPGKVQEKVGDYLQAGVRAVWVIDLRRRALTIYRNDDPTPAVLRDGDALADLPELPGFAAGVADLFA